MSFESEDDQADEDAIYTSWRGKRTREGSSTSLRSRIFGLAGRPRSSQDGPKSITTAPGQLCAGETETEGEEPVSAMLVAHGRHG